MIFAASLMNKPLFRSSGEDLRKYATSLLAQARQLLCARE